MMGAEYWNRYGDSPTETGKDDEKVLRKGIFSKILIALIVAANLAFVVAILIIFCLTYSEPSTLIMAWFGFSTGELWALAFVKKQKLKKEEREHGTAGESVKETDQKATAGDDSGGGAEADPAAE